jgi:hypothetical protein
MTVFNLIPISFISSGFIIGSLSYEINKDINNKMSNEPIYMFPSEIELIKEPKSIIKIENCIMSKVRKYPIGYVKLNEFIKVPTIVYKNVYNIMLDKYELKKYIEYDEIKKTIGSQILFPNIHDKIIIDPDLLTYKKINILFNNSNFIKSSCKNLIERYEKLVRYNIPNFKSDLIINCSSDFISNSNFLELEENILGDNSELYLIVNPINNKLVTNTLAESSEIILKQKYKDDIRYSHRLSLLSFSFISIGVAIGFVSYFTKN